MVWTLCHQRDIAPSHLVLGDSPDPFRLVDVSDHGIFFTLFLLFMRWVPMVAIAEVKSSQPPIHMGRVGHRIMQFRQESPSRSGMMAYDPPNHPVPPTKRPSFGGIRQHSGRAPCGRKAPGQWLYPLGYHSPFPIHGMDRAMGLRDSKLGWIVLGIFSAFGAVFGMLHLNRLQRHHHPIFESDRFCAASDDKFFISVQVDPKFHTDRTRSLLEAAHATFVETLEEEAWGAPYCLSLRPDRGLCPFVRRSRSTTIMWIQPKYKPAVCVDGYAYIMIVPGMAIVSGYGVAESVRIWSSGISRITDWWTRKSRDFGYLPVGWP